jgi:membrane protease YdiL (CAAX protease family)
MLVAGLLLSLGVALVPAGYFIMRYPEGGMTPLVARAVLGSLALALVMEAFFRGIAMGIFLRAMWPSAALGVSAAFFALVLSVVPPPGVNVVDPDAGSAGLELLRLMAARFADWRSVCGDFAPLLALGTVLAYARWRTASLWLPVGLHAGWLSAKGILAQLSTPTGANEAVLSGGLLQQGLIPLAAIVLAGFLAHHITFNPEDEGAALP